MRERNFVFVYCRVKMEKKKKKKLIQREPKLQMQMRVAQCCQWVSVFSTEKVSATVAAAVGALV